MAKYKLLKKVANSTSFRYGGQKYETQSVIDNQGLLKSLHKDGCWFISEIKDSKKTTKKTIVNDTEKENDNAND
jgi:hypothetical protein|tara:strand:- start:772 stop:993 length:222 start_codon:yes stop_codon:yes gene_type:complete